MMRTRVPSKVTGSTRLRGAQCSPELGLRSMDFRAPENLIFPALAQTQESQDILSLCGDKIFQT